MEKFGPDPFFYTYIIVSALIVLVSLYLITKPYWEQRWLIERINASAAQSGVPLKWTD